MAMHFNGEQTIHSPIQRVWAFFMEPENVASCAPGYKSMEILGPDHYKPTVAVGVGPVRATFTLDIRLVDLREPNHATVVVRGQAAGNAVEATAEADMEEIAENETHLRWNSQVNLNGPIASVGSRLIESTANKLTVQFFNCARQKLESEG